MDHPSLSSVEWWVVCKDGSTSLFNVLAIYSMAGFVYFTNFMVLA
jgi:hypothetical protein